MRVVPPMPSPSRTTRVFMPVRDLLQDLRYAVRLLIKAPGFTAVAVLSVALGVGANSAVFSFVDSILLRPLDVVRPRDVVRITTATPAQRFSNLSFLELETIRERNRTLSGLAAEWRTDIALRTHAPGGGPGSGPSSGIERDRPDQEVARVTFACLVNHDYFTTLGMTPALGRNFLADEDSPAARDIVAIVSDRAWRTHFDGDPRIVGRRITVNGQPTVVVGVAPPQFTGTDLYQRPEVYLPLAVAPRIRPGTKLLQDPADRGLIVRARLRPGVGVEAAAADVQALARALEETHPETNRQRTASVLRDLDQRLQTLTHDRQMSVMLVATVLLVLVIAAVNVANLLLGRAAMRAREIAIRTSVGASRLRLVRQLLTESLVLALLGGAMGLVLAQWAIWSLRAIPLPTDLPIVIDVRFDGRVFLYGFSLAFAAGLVFGVVPALRATRRDLTSPVKGGVVGQRRGRFQGFGGRYALIAAQAALSTVLLICAGLFVKSFHRAADASPGYRVDGVLLASFSPALVAMPKAEIEAFYEQLQDRVRALPGVASVTLAKHVNLGPDAYSRRIIVEGQQYPASRPWDTIDNNYVDDGFFDTMGTPIVRGRAIDARDDRRAPKVAVVNETMARRFWPDREAVGQRFTLVGDTRESVEVIGVARNAKYFNAVEPTALSYFYLPYRQHPQDRMTLHVRASGGDALALVPAVRREVRALAPELPMFDVHRMRDVFERKGLLAARLVAQMVGLTALIGATLALVGLYAVIAFIVSHRTREIGLRMALGATRASVTRMTLSWGLRAAGAGMLLGLVLAANLSKALGAMIGTVSPRDPAVFAGVLLALLGAALAASWLPARRAASIEPTIALRQE